MVCIVLFRVEINRKDFGIFKVLDCNEKKFFCLKVDLYVVKNNMVGLIVGWKILDKILIFKFIFMDIIVEGNVRNIIKL